jgi:hypothetical protein
MFRIIESNGYSVTVESTLATIQAVENRLKMLKRNNPCVSYWYDTAPRILIHSNKVTSMAIV